MQFSFEALLHLLLATALNLSAFISGTGVQPNPDQSLHIVNINEQWTRPAIPPSAIININIGFNNSQTVVKVKISDLTLLPREYCFDCYTSDDPSGSGNSEMIELDGEKLVAICGDSQGLAATETCPDRESLGHFLMYMHQTESRLAISREQLESAPVLNFGGSSPFDVSTLENTDNIIPRAAAGFTPSGTNFVTLPSPSTSTSTTSKTSTQPTTFRVFTSF
ncbi:hypothetical protein G7Y89_g11679 [Cudoniella acicularis]|uniref:Uncharacterized protein n=1 Tax=Cudoniella acicularis TaxID=354080 RepID=A0A8H4RDA2_9HELO|nr:hypothetical protein G7Y89_g11679 [Cudoniella acicularis]